MQEQMKCIKVLCVYNIQYLKKKKSKESVKPEKLRHATLRREILCFVNRDFLLNKKIFVK